MEQATEKKQALLQRLLDELKEHHLEIADLQAFDSRKSWSLRSERKAYTKEHNRFLKKDIQYQRLDSKEVWALRPGARIRFAGSYS